MSAPNTDVYIIPVIRTSLTVRGKGTQEDPMRRITQYWSCEGELLAEQDPDPPEPKWRALLKELDNNGGLGMDTHARIRKILGEN